MKIAICGFSGAGKTSLLKKIEHNNKIDLDEYIWKSCGDLTIGKYIENIGFEEFRKVEKEALLKIATSGVDCLLALGGGTLTKATFELLKANRWEVIWLNVPFEICFERIKDDSNRPMVKLGEVVLKTVYLERVKIYQLADFTVSSIEEGNLLIAKLVKEGFYK